MAYTDIDDPSAHFQTVLYTGNGSNGTAITNSGNSNLQPDWLWIKSRSSGSLAHRLYDSSRGVANDLRSHGDNGDTQESNALASFNSDGFTIGSAGDVNSNSATFVAWQWKANGGTTTTNDASATSVGTIDSVYQANTTAGFSIVTYTGAGGNQTVAHGLGAVPNVIFIKRRDDAGDWTSYHSDLGNEKYLRLNSNNAIGDQATYFNDTSPTSTVFTIGNAGDVNTSSGTHVAYCFAPIQGYSKYSSYIGNGSAGGPFIYTGFKPAWVLIKATDADDWRLYDSKRSTSSLGGINPINRRLRAHLASAETTADGSQSEMDFLSNGFKLNSTGGGVNTTSQKYIYMAIAQSPFVSSGGTPTTGRFEGQ